MWSTRSWMDARPSSLSGAYWLSIRLNLPAKISVVFIPAFSSAPEMSTCVATTPIEPTSVVPSAMNTFEAAEPIQ